MTLAKKTNWPQLTVEQWACLAAVAMGHVHIAHFNIPRHYFHCSGVDMSIEGRSLYRRGLIREPIMGGGPLYLTKRGKQLWDESLSQTSDSTEA